MRNFLCAGRNRNFYIQIGADLIEFSNNLSRIALYTRYFLR